MKSIFTEEDLFRTYKMGYYGEKTVRICRENNWIPLKPSPELASIVAHLMGDGNLSKDRMVGDFRFYGTIDSLYKIKGILRDNFNLAYKWILPHDKGGCFILKYNNAIFSRILELVGVPRGNKVLTAFEIPNWIMFSNKKIKRAFLRSIFSDEMSKPYKKSRNSWGGLEFGMSKDVEKIPSLITFLDQIKYLLAEFNITTSEVRIKKSCEYHRKDGHTTLPARFRISINLKNRKKFFDNVGFEDIKKQKLLYTSIKEKFN